jgi:hypothetical protein
MKKWNKKIRKIESPGLGLAEELMVCCPLFILWRTGSSTVSCLSSNLNSYSPQIFVCREFYDTGKK